MYSPVSGEVVSVNEELSDSPVRFVAKLAAKRVSVLVYLLESETWWLNSRSYSLACLLNHTTLPFGES